MRTLRLLLLAATAGVALGWAGPAAALDLGLGADWLLEPQAGGFQVTLGGETPVARHLSAGGRIGVMLLDLPNRVGVPIDGLLRARLGRVYVEGLLGPWILFGDSQPIRLHTAIGFGILARRVSFGVEVGYLDPTATIGLRLAFPI